MFELLGKAWRITALKCITLALLFPISFAMPLTPARAAGDLLIAPTRVVLDGRRGTEVILNNIGDEEATYRITLELRRMNAQGRLEDVDLEKATDQEKSALDAIRYAPRRVTLPPNQPQSIRIGLQPNDGLPTDRYGRTIIDGLQPYEQILIGIDASSLPDPFVQPANSGIVVTPRPGIPSIIELPLVSAGEISGTLQREGGKPLSGVELELVDKNGRVVKSTRSEFDGFFLFEFVPYGNYKLRVAPLSANIIGLDPELSGVAALNKSSGTVDMGIIIARSIPRISAIPNKGTANPQAP